MAFQLLLQLRVSQPWRQVLRVEVGCDDQEDIMVRRSGRRARTAEKREFLAAHSAHVFVARAADLAFGERGHLGRNAISDPMHEPRPNAAVDVEHGEGEASRVPRRIAPRQLRRNVVALAIRSAGGDVADFLCEKLAVLEGCGGEREHLRGLSCAPPERGKRQSDRYAKLLRFDRHRSAPSGSESGA